MDARVQMLYCGARVSAARLGRFKLHFTTTRWTDEAGQICLENVICNCHGHEHSPPLMYDLHADPGETAPLDVSPPDHARVVERAQQAKARHEASVVPVPSQTERLPNAWMLPCCGTEKGSLRWAWSVLTNTCGC